MELLKSKNAENQLFQYMTRAIREKDSELEFIYGINNYTDKIERLDFIRLLSSLKQRYTTLSEENTQNNKDIFFLLLS